MGIQIETVEAAFVDGEAAFHRGEPITNGPRLLDRSSPLFAAWRRGWTSGRLGGGLYAARVAGSETRSATETLTTILRYATEQANLAYTGTPGGNARAEAFKEIVDLIDGLTP